MTYQGMFLRQYMGQHASQVPNTTGEWQASPDLLVYGTQQAYITALFNDSTDNYASRNWYFSQAPTPGKANYIYVRAVNTEGNQTSTIYLFYADETTLLQPQQWKSDTFTVQTFVQGVTPPPPANQNYFSISSIGKNSLVVSFDATNQDGSLITWTPPAGSGATPHYYLIAWVDNTADNSNKPPFSTLGAFTDLQALGDYVQKYANMLFLDTWYQGIQLRQYVGEDASKAGSGAQTSPDIIVTGNTAAPDTSVYTTNSSYTSSTLNQTVVVGMQNFIYLRGINTTSTSASARVYLFYTTADQISPSSWQTNGFTVAGQPCNYIDLKTNAQGQVVVSDLPIVWQVPNNPSPNYILIAYVDNQEDPTTSTAPDLSIFGFVNPLAVQQFVANQSRMAWLAIQTQSPPSRPDMTFEYPLTISAGKSYVGLQFQNITTQGTVTFSVPGENASTTLVQTQMHIPDGNAGVIWKVNFSQEWDTSLVLNYWKNGGTDGSPANITTINTPLPQTEEGSIGTLRDLLC